MFLSCLTKPLIKNFAARFESGGTASAAALKAAEQQARRAAHNLKVIAAPNVSKKFPR